MSASINAALALLLLIPTAIEKPERPNPQLNQLLEKEQVKKNYTILYEFYPQGDKNGPRCQIRMNDTGITSIICFTSAS